MKKHIVPRYRQTYTNRNGDKYICEFIYSDRKAQMRRVSDGWTLYAHNIQQYEDGTIEWDYSTNGHWVEKGEKL